MKILSIAIMAVLLLSLIAPYAIAEEANENITGNVSEITEVPKAEEEIAETEEELELNESVSAGKIAWRQFQLWFTFNQERKLEREMELARLRLIQAKIAARNNNSEAVEKALEAHERIMERARLRMKALNIAATDGLNETALKLVGLERAIQVHERRIAFLKNVLASANLTESQREKIESRLERVSNVTAKLVELNRAKQEQIKTRIMATKNMTEEEAKQFMEEKKVEIKSRVRERLGKAGTS